MIGSLRGQVSAADGERLLLDVGGVGYEVAVSARTRERLPRPGDEAFLLIHTSVREDAITLYGFHDQAEKALFLLLTGVSGVGPKLALTILSGLSAEELCRAIAARDLARLTTISGVGKKTAQRLCMELADKVGGLEIDLGGGEGGGSPDVVPVQEGMAMDDAASALVNLGYPAAVAWQALRKVQQQDPEAAANMEVGELIRQALRQLA